MVKVNARAISSWQRTINHTEPDVATCGPARRLELAERRDCPIFDRDINPEDSPGRLDDMSLLRQE